MRTDGSGHAKSRPKKAEPDWATYRVLKDTREQEGWDFAAGAHCLGTSPATLKTGDYTLAGYEDVLSVERKRSTGELAGNVLEARFERELERLDDFKYPFLVLEFDLADVASFPANSGIPRPRWKHLRVTPRFLMARLNEYQVNHKVRILFVGRHGREFCSSLFKRVTEAEKRPCPSAPEVKPAPARS